MELLGIIPKSPSIRYRTAKVAIVGDSGVGKSCLALLLTGRKFEAQKSTHARNVFRFELSSVDVEDDIIELRETFLWDMGGQRDYRIIHELSLDKVTVGLVVFDGTEQMNTFKGVRYWNRALRRVQTKFLVAAKCVPELRPATDEALRKEVEDGKFKDYYETNAERGEGINRLLADIRHAINWDKLTQVSSTELFQSIRTFLIEQRFKGKQLVPVKHLYDSFRDSIGLRYRGIDLRAEFETCIRLAENEDLIRLFNFGDLVLLQPELLDTYASALVTTVRLDPKGMGSISEEDALDKTLNIPEGQQIEEKGIEKLLRIATVKELLHQQLILREPTDQGQVLVFPSQLSFENPDLSNPKGREVTYFFEGPVPNIYAALVVRLAYSHLFHFEDRSKNIATFTTLSKSTCGLQLLEKDEGRGELTLFFDNKTNSEMKAVLDRFVKKHLETRIFPGTELKRRRIVICTNPLCEEEFTESVIAKRRFFGGDTLQCPACHNLQSLPASDEYPVSAEVEEDLKKMDRNAEIQRLRAVAQSLLQGKQETGDYDVFLCYNFHERQTVNVIAKRLKEEGILPWPENSDVPLKLPLAPLEIKNLARMKNVAVFAGEERPTPWENPRQRELILELQQNGCRIIHVLLREAYRWRDKFEPLREGETGVDFGRSDADPLTALVDLIQQKVGRTMWRQTLDEMPRTLTDEKLQELSRDFGMKQGEQPMSTHPFDVFLAHNSQDKTDVELLNTALKARGLSAWFDDEQIPPGRWFQDIIQQAIPQVKSAAIILGPHGLGRWEAVELRAFISQCVEHNIPVIPVLLPGVSTLPSDLLFLRQLKWVAFSSQIDDTNALDLLEWGITGRRP